MSISSVANVVQILFSLLIGGITIYNLRLTRKYNKLIFKPLVGVVNVITARHLLLDKKDDLYDNVRGLSIEFIIKNTGTLAAKKLKIKTIGKIGDTILPIKVTDNSGCSMILPNMPLINQAFVNKEFLDRLVNDKERLIFKTEITYTDLEGYENYKNTEYFEILLTSKNPLNVRVSALLSPEVNFD